MYCKLVFASNCQFPRSWHVTIWHLNAAQSAIVYPSRSHSPVAWVALVSPLVLGNFHATYFLGQPWMTGKDSSASNVVSYLAVKIMSWSTWWCQEPPLNQSPSLGWWLIASLIVGIMRMTLGCRPCSFRVQSVFSVHSWSKGVTLVHFKDHHNQQNDAPQHHLFTQHPWLQMFPSFASSLVRLQLKRTLAFSFFQHVILNHFDVRGESSRVYWARRISQIPRILKQTALSMGWLQQKHIKPRVNTNTRQI